MYNEEKAVQGDLLNLHIIKLILTFGNKTKGPVLKEDSSSLIFVDGS